MIWTVAGVGCDEIVRANPRGRSYSRWHILDMDMVNDDKKISLLESTTKPISIMGKNYSDSLIEYILINNFNDRDEKELYQHFSEYDDIIQVFI